MVDIDGGMLEIGDAATVREYDTDELIVLTQDLGRLQALPSGALAFVASRDCVGASLPSVAAVTSRDCIAVSLQTA